MAVRDVGVVVVGAGPTGLRLAGELALAGVEVEVLERRGSQAVMGQRAGGLHARTLEELDQRGIVERFLAEGTTHREFPIAGVPLDFEGLPTRFNYLVGLWQAHIERILAGWVGELGVRVRYGADVAEIAAGEDVVEVALADGGERLRAGWLVGCDGGRSFVRKAVGIGFEGTEPTVSNLIGEVVLAEDPGEAWGLRRDERGVHGLSKLEETGTARVMVTEREARRGEPTLEELREELRAVYGSDFGAHSPVWLSRFTDATRQATAYRKGRVLLAGDAAHTHPPDGGQGLQTGMQDAVNLGWKLAAVAKGEANEGLLDTYEAERAPVAARVLRKTLTHVAMRGTDARGAALREAFGELLATPEANRRFAARTAGLDVRYDLGGAHPLVGRRMPDLELETADGRVRVFELLHEARPLVLSFGAALEMGPWAERVRVVEARYDGVWSTPDAGVVCAPAAVLVRPDGYVAWAGAASSGAGGDGESEGLGAALELWVGRPR